MPTNTPVENHNLRSEEVKEVLASRPKLSILFGNSFIVVILCGFLAFLNLYKVTTSEILQFRVQNSVTKNINGTYNLTLLTSVPLTDRIGVIAKPTKVALSLDNGGKTLKIEPTLKTLDYSNNVIIIQVSSGNLQEILELKQNKIGNDLFGSLQIPIDSVSLYRLFIRKMTENQIFNAR